jgi:hypothetical protein
MWKYFESFHITQIPTYMSMYFPAQGMAMAAGKVVAGHPWFGVLATDALMCAAICWMLQGWLPPGWALLGGMLSVVRLGLFTYWINGYNGGAIAAIGGALVLGAFPRIRRTAKARHFILLATGCILLANSRPVEGLLVCVPAVITLLWWFASQQRLSSTLTTRRIAPAILLLVVAAAWMGYYNRRVFGNPLILPYQVNRQTYAVAPVFLWLSPKPSPEYRYSVMRDFYIQAELKDFLYARTTTGFLACTVQKLGIVTLFFFGVALLPPLLMLPWALRDRRIRYLVFASLCYGFGLAVNAWFFPHYAAPFAGGIYVLLLQCMRHLRVWRLSGVPSGLMLVRSLTLVCAAMVLVRLGAEPFGLTVNRFPSMWYGTEPLGLPRARVMQQMSNYPGLQLAIVRYAPNHLPFDDWVYNSADIDNSKVVWAREMDSGRAAPELLSYYGSRKVWLVEPDAIPPKVSPYPAPSTRP